MVEGGHHFIKWPHPPPPTIMLVYVPAKQPWRMGVNEPHESTGTDTTTKPKQAQPIPKPSACFMESTLRTVVVPYFQDIIAASTRFFNGDSREGHSDPVTVPWVAIIVDIPALEGVAATDGHRGTCQVNIGSVQHCSISTANALWILQSCTKPSICRP